MSSLELAKALQRRVDNSEEAVVSERNMALKKFDQIKADLSMDELMSLAEKCGCEEGSDHCVYCAAWDEFVSRGGND